MRISVILTSLLFSLFMPVTQAQLLDDILGSVTDSISDLTEEVLPGISNVRVGVGPTFGPDYKGSDDYGVSVAPLISLRYKDILQVDNNNIKVNILGSDSIVRSDNFNAGPLLSLDFGRDESDSPDLIGLGDVDTSFEFGIFASYRVGPTRARIRARKDLASGHDGVEVIGDFRILFYRGDKITIVTTLSGSWVDDSYMDSFFSITPEQSLASGLPQYDASAAFRDVTFHIATNYQISNRWAVIANTGYTRLTGDAKESPIVSLRGSPDQFFGGVFAVYSF